MSTEKNDREIHFPIDSIDRERCSAQGIEIALQRHYLQGHSLYHCHR